VVRGQCIGLHKPLSTLGSELLPVLPVAFFNVVAAGHFKLDHEEPVLTSTRLAARNSRIWLDPLFGGRRAFVHNRSQHQGEDRCRCQQRRCRH
jgi:hypothetical protein